MHLGNGSLLVNLTQRRLSHPVPMPQSCQSDRKVLINLGGGYKAEAPKLAMGLPRVPSARGSQRGSCFCSLPCKQYYTFTSLSSRPWNTCFTGSGTLVCPDRGTSAATGHRGSHSQGEVEKRTERRFTTKRGCKMEG